MTVDLLWIVGGDPDAPDREELKYSLRSFSQNLRITVRDTWIVGDTPSWFTGVKMPLEPNADKWRNQQASLSAYVNHPHAADEVIVLNDDMYLLEPVDEIVPIRNFRRSDEWEQNHYGHGWECWTCAVHHAARFVSDELGSPIYLYENHTPLRFSTRQLRDLTNRWPSEIPFMVGEAFPIAGIGGEGRTAGNAKIKGNTKLADKLALDMPYISGNPDTWNGVLGDHIKELFPYPSRWEVA